MEEESSFCTKDPYLFLLVAKYKIAISVNVILAISTNLNNEACTDVYMSVIVWCSDPGNVLMMQSEMC